jgi:hypothetical protein
LSSRPRIAPFTCVLFIALVAASACSESSKDGVTSIAAAHSTNKNDRLYLPDILREVSGLAATGDESVLLHADELGLVYHLSYGTGAIKPFASFGQPPVKADFEGIAVLSEQLYLLTSNGTLYSREITSPVTNVAFKKHNTGLKKHCEFEGLGSLVEANLLALICKEPKRKRDKGQLLVYFWSPLSKTITEDATLRVDISHVGQAVHPSAIDWREDNNSFVVVAARERLILSLSQTGELLGFGNLPESAEHPQTEGLAIANDLFYLADESVAGKPATLSRHKLTLLDSILSIDAH